MRTTILALLLSVSAVPAMAQRAQSVPAPTAGAQSAPACQNASFSVTASGGFVGPNGQPWNMRGLDGANVTEALAAFPNVVNQFPGMTAIRLAVVPGKDSQDQVNQAVLDYTSKGIVVEVEDHSGQGDNVAWYQQQAQTFKDNSLVFLETPNEPNGDVENNQIAIIKAVRAEGFNNPVGVQWDFGNGETSDNLAQVTAAVGTTNLFGAPHIYGSPWQMQAAQADQSAGLYTVVDEFGDAENGFTIDPQGKQTVDSVIQDNKSGAIGAIFWAMGNGYHSDGADSACTDPSCSSLTSMGTGLQSWLSASAGGGPIACDVSGLSLQAALSTPPTAAAVDKAANNAASSVISCYQQTLGISNNQMPSASQSAPKPISTGTSQQASQSVSSQQSGQQASAAMTSDVIAAATAQQAVCPVPNEITPGISSITDAAGQVFTVDPQSGNQVMVNGQSATPNGTGSQTSAVTSVDGAIYGQDENTHQWFRLDGQGWTPLTALPASGQTPTPTVRWTTPNNT